MEEKEDNTIYKVVVNHEEQYSIWFADREPRWAGEKLEKPVRRQSVWPISRKFGPTCDHLASGKKWKRLTRISSERGKTCSDAHIQRRCRLSVSQKR